MVRGVTTVITQGRVRDGVMEGQGLHYRWGDGSKFVCKEKQQCLTGGQIVAGEGRFRSVNRGPKDDSVSEKVFSEGWYVGQTRAWVFNLGCKVWGSLYRCGYGPIPAQPWEFAAGKDWVS